MFLLYCPIYINTDILTTKPMLAHFLFNLLILDYRQKWMKLHGLQKKKEITKQRPSPALVRKNS